MNRRAYFVRWKEKGIQSWEKNTMIFSVYLLNFKQTPIKVPIRLQTLDLTVRIQHFPLQQHFQLANVVTKNTSICQKYICTVSTHTGGTQGLKKRKKESNSYVKAISTTVLKWEHLWLDWTTVGRVLKCYRKWIHCIYNYSEGHQDLTIKTIPTLKWQFVCLLVLTATWSMVIIWITLKLHRLMAQSGISI